MTDDKPSGEVMMEAVRRAGPLVERALTDPDLTAGAVILAAATSAITSGHSTPETVVQFLRAAADLIEVQPPPVVDQDTVH